MDSETEAAFCDGCELPVDRCLGYGSCNDRLKAELTKLREEHEKAMAVVEAAKKMQRHLILGGSLEEWDVVRLGLKAALDQSRKS